MALEGTLAWLFPTLTNLTDQLKDTAKTVDKAATEIPDTAKMIRNCCLAIIVCTCVLSFLLVILIIVLIRLRYSQFSETKTTNELENDREEIEVITPFDVGDATKISKEKVRALTC